MKEFKNTNDILDFAMAAEQRAVDFYSGLAENAKNTEMRDTFMQFAKEEMGHKARLAKIKSEGIFDIPSEKITDLKISDYTSDVDPHPDMDYQEALVVAMKAEKNAFRLYTALANKAETDDFKNLFLSLAQEEAKHKLRFEVEYDDYVLKDN